MSNERTETTGCRPSVLEGVPRFSHYSHDLECSIRPDPIGGWVKLSDVEAALRASGDATGDGEVASSAGDPARNPDDAEVRAAKEVLADEGVGAASWLVRRALRAAYRAAGVSGGVPASGATPDTQPDATPTPTRDIEWMYREATDGGVRHTPQKFRQETHHPQCASILSPGQRPCNCWHVAGASRETAGDATTCEFGARRAELAPTTCAGCFSAGPCEAVATVARDLGLLIADADSDPKLAELTGMVVDLSRIRQAHALLASRSGGGDTALLDSVAGATLPNGEPSELTWRQLIALNTKPVLPSPASDTRGDGAPDGAEFDDTQHESLSRRLAVFAYSIDGYDTLSEDEQMICRDAARWAMQLRSEATPENPSTAAASSPVGDQETPRDEPDPLTVECSYCLAKPGKSCRLSKAGARMVSGHKGDPCDPHLTRIDRARYEHSRTETAGSVSKSDGGE